MNHHDWKHSSDAYAMFQWATHQTPCPVAAHRPILDRRRMRLFACACARLRVLSMNLLKCVEVAEAFADGKATTLHLSKASMRIDIPQPLFDRWNPEDLVFTACIGSYGLLRSDMRSYLDHRRKGSNNEARLLRCIDGSRFMPAIIDPDWITEDVEAMARDAYMIRDSLGWLDTDRLRVLSDALVDAGCPEVVCPRCYGEPERCPDCVGKSDGCQPKEDCNVPHPLLAHLRDPGPHARGCYVIDALTDR